MVRNIKDIGKEIYVNASERKKIVKRLIKGKGSIKQETFFKRRDGTIMPVSLFLKLIRGKDNKSLYLSGIVEDISDRKNTEENLIQERNQLKTLIDSIPDYVYMKDIDGKFILTNQAFEKLLNLPFPADPIGKTDHELQLSSFASEFLGNDLGILKEGKKISNLEIIRNV